MKKARVIAFYLPQFHPTKENDEMWGKGFTEWTNVAKAKPLFKNHYQPQIPSELGFYDLRLAESRRAQAKLAQEHGIEGFCYWHYWFGNGRTILDMPFQEVLKDKEITLPFCLGWANHSWSNKTWQKSNGISKTVEFIKQEYPGEDDYKKHFYHLLEAFKDSRYIKVDGKPVFLIFDPTAIPDTEKFICLWQKLARENGLKGIYFIARYEPIGSFKEKIDLSEESIKMRYEKIIALGYDAINSATLRYARIRYNGKFKIFLRTVMSKMFGNFTLEKYDYKRIIKYLITDNDYNKFVYPTLIPRWDKTPRRGKDAEILYNTEPKYFKEHINDALKAVENKDFEHKIIFVFAWNEWGEGAYLEPDIKYGRQHLETLKECIED